MKEITINNVTMSNFLSYGDNVKIQIKDGVNIVTGVNNDEEGRTNAIGKSSIADAIFFVLYGNALRDIPNAQVCNIYTRQPASVTLDMNCGDDNYIINRKQSSRQTVTVIKNGDVVELEEGGLAEYNDYIASIIEVTPEYMAACVLPRAASTPIMAKGEVVKRKIVNSIIRTDVGEYVEKIKQYGKAANEDMKTVIALSEQTMQRISEGEKELLAMGGERYTEAETKLNDAIAGVEETLNKLRKMYQLRQNKLVKLVKEDVDRVKSEHAAIVKQDGELRQTIVVVNEAYRQANQHVETCKDGVCPTCKQGVEDIMGDIMNKRKEETERYEKYQAKLAEHDREMNRIMGELEELVRTKRENDKLMEEMKNIKEQAKESQESLDKLMAAKSSISQEVSNRYIMTKNSVEKSRASLAKMTEKIDYLKKEVDLARKAIMALGKNGIDQYVINHILGKLNERLNYWLGQMNYNFGYRVEFDYDLKMSIIYPEQEDGYTPKYSYGNLSGAEGMYVDLACQLAYRDILVMQNIVKINLTIFDEMIDTTLDEVATEVVMGLIEKVDGSKIVITHKRNIIDSGKYNTILLDKSDKITTLFRGN